MIDFKDNLNNDTSGFKIDFTEKCGLLIATFDSLLWLSGMHAFASIGRLVLINKDICFDMDLYFRFIPTFVVRFLNH